MWHSLTLESREDEGWARGSLAPSGKEGERRSGLFFSRAVGLVWGSCFALRERADGWERREEVGGLSARLGSAV